MRTAGILASAALALLCAGLLHAAQPALPFSLEQLKIGLPEAGAPRAVVGAHAVVTERTAGTPALQVYRPRDLAPFTGTNALPVVVWGNGSCLADSSQFAGYLSTIASHGFLIVTSASVPDQPQARATSATLIKAIEWAQAEGSRAGSALVGRIRTDGIAAMGMSCGGNLAIEAARDPRVKTLAVWNSGVWISGEMRTADGQLLVATTKADLARIHGPTLYINGDKLDPASVNAADDFERIGHVPVFFGSRHGSGHSGTYSHANGGEFANLAVAWLNWQLKGDARSAKVFTGTDCSLCRDANWTVRHKGL